MRSAIQNLRKSPVEIRSGHFPFENPVVPNFSGSLGVSLHDVLLVVSHHVNLQGLEQDPYSCRTLLQGSRDDSGRPKLHQRILDAPLSFSSRLCFPYEVLQNSGGHKSSYFPEFSFGKGAQDFLERYLGSLQKRLFRKAFGLLPDAFAEEERLVRFRFVAIVRIFPFASRLFVRECRLGRRGLALLFFLPLDLGRMLAQTWETLDDQHDDPGSNEDGNPEKLQSPTK